MTATDCGSTMCSCQLRATTDKVDVQVHIWRSLQTDDVTLLLVDLCMQLSGDRHV